MFDFLSLIGKNLPSGVQYPEFSVLCFLLIDFLLNRSFSAFTGFHEHEMALNKLEIMLLVNSKMVQLFLKKVALSFRKVAMKYKEIVVLLGGYALKSG